MKRSFFAFAAVAALAFATSAAAAPLGMGDLPTQKEDGSTLSGHTFFAAWSPSGKVDVGELMFPKLGVFVDVNRVAYTNYPFAKRLTSDGRPDARYDLLKFYSAAGDYTFMFATNVEGCAAGDDRYVLPKTFQTSFNAQKDPAAEKLLQGIKISSETDGATIEGLGVLSVRFPSCMKMTIKTEDGMESAILRFAFGSVIQ